MSIVKMGIKDHSLRNRSKRRASQLLHKVPLLALSVWFLFWLKGVNFCNTPQALQTSHHVNENILDASPRISMPTLVTKPSNKESFNSFTQKAKMEQIQFCQDLKDDKILPPDLGYEENRQVDFELTKVDIQEAARIPGASPFSTVVYAEGDILSKPIASGAGWEMTRVNEIGKIFKDYAFKHEVPMSDLTFVDIGANVGWFTMQLAALGVNVAAFEPMEANIQLIRRSLCLPENTGMRDRVTLYTTGLGTHPAKCIIISGNDNRGDGHVKCVKDGFVNPTQDGYAVRGKITVNRLDDIFTAGDKTVLAVKMDTEGFEANVVGGGKHFFCEAKIPYIFSEFSPAMIASKGGNATQLMQTMLDAGYHVRRGTHVPYLTREQAFNVDSFATIEEFIFDLLP